MNKTGARGATPIAVERSSTGCAIAPASSGSGKHAAV